jgi:hypothetical protein
MMTPKKKVNTQMNGGIYYVHGFEDLILFFIFLFIYSHVHTLFESFLTPSLTSSVSPPTPPRFQADPVLPLSLILLKRRHKHIKKDKVFLLVKDNYTERVLALPPCTNVLQPKLIHL